MRDEYLVFGSPLIGQAEIDEVVASLRSGWIGSGPKVRRFEEMLEAYTGRSTCALCFVVHGGSFSACGASASKQGTRCWFRR